MHSTVKFIRYTRHYKVKLNEININNYPKIIAKTFKIDQISPLIDHGHIW